MAPRWYTPYFSICDSSNSSIGESAGTIFPINSTQTKDDIESAVKRFTEAVKADPRSRTHIPVLCLDGAQVNKAMPSDSINPNMVCYNPQ